MPLWGRQAAAGLLDSPPPAFQPRCVVDGPGGPVRSRRGNVSSASPPGDDGPQEHNGGAHAPASSPGAPGSRSWVIHQAALFPVAAASQVFQDCTAVSVTIARGTVTHIRSVPRHSTVAASSGRVLFFAPDLQLPAELRWAVNDDHRQTPPNSAYAMLCGLLDLGAGVHWPAADFDGPVDAVVGVQNLHLPRTFPPESAGARAGEDAVDLPEGRPVKVPFLDDLRGAPVNSGPWRCGTGGSPATLGGDEDGGPWPWPQSPSGVMAPGR